MGGRVGAVRRISRNWRRHARCNRVRHAASSFESINAAQLATTTDRLLAHGRFGKRRGPHVAPRYLPLALEELTVRVTPRPAPKRKRSVTKRLLAVAVLALASGAAVGVRSSHAAPSVLGAAHAR